jgi:hypothetical protein
MAKTSSYDTAKPKGTAPNCTSANTPMHKLLATGKHPKVSVPSPRTPA